MKTNFGKSPKFFTFWINPINRLTQENAEDFNKTTNIDVIDNDINVKLNKKSTPYEETNKSNQTSRYELPIVIDHVETED
jgi:hypothetical protein